jgi:hypothetical protein
MVDDQKNLQQSLAELERAKASADKFREELARQQAAIAQQRAEIEALQRRIGAQTAVGSISIEKIEGVLGENLPPDAEKVIHAFGDAKTPVPPELVWELVEMLQTKAFQSEPLRERIAELRRVAREGLQQKAVATGQVHIPSVNAWLKSHWVQSRNCPICGDIQWGIGPTLVQMPVSALGRHAAPRTNPCVSLVSRKCGFTMYFNAVIMGLLPKEEE